MSCTCSNNSPVVFSSCVTCLDLRGVRPIIGLFLSQLSMSSPSSCLCFLLEYEDVRHRSPFLPPLMCWFARKSCPSLAIVVALDASVFNTERITLGALPSFTMQLPVPRLIARVLLRPCLSLWVDQKDISVTCATIAADYLITSNTTTR
jgi:hypothetical protein